MDLLVNPKGLVRLWTCLMSDYECLLHEYIAKSGYTFSHFAKCAKDSQITLLYHASVTHGRKRDVHHEMIGQIILNTAKDLWLHPGSLIKSFKEGKDKDTSGDSKEADDGDEHVKMAKSASDEWNAKVKKIFEDGFDGDVLLKYQIGGFFLTYVMFDRQPYPGLLKIGIDPKDYEQFKNFQANVLNVTKTLGPQATDVVDECRFIFQRLRINYAFTVTALSDKYDVSPMARSYLNVKNDEVVELLKSDKIIMDTLAYSLITVKCPAIFKGYIGRKQNFLKKTGFPTVTAIGDSNTAEGGATAGWISEYKAICNGKHFNDTLENSKKEDSLLSTLECAHGIGEMATSSVQLQEMSGKPLFTVSSLLGSDIANKVFMTEATKRLKRLQMISAKQSEGGVTGRGRAKVAKKPYKNEDGVFGRLKRDALVDGDGNVPTRMKASYHLWNYIKGKGYQPDSKDSEFGQAMTMAGLASGNGEGGGSVVNVSFQQERQGAVAKHDNKVKVAIKKEPEVEDGEAPEMQLMMDEDSNSNGMLAEDLAVSDSSEGCSE